MWTDTIGDMMRIIHHVRRMRDSTTGRINVIRIRWRIIWGKWKWARRTRLAKCWTILPRISKARILRWHWRIELAGIGRCCQVLIFTSHFLAGIFYVRIIVVGWWCGTSCTSARWRLRFRSHFHSINIFIRKIIQMLLRWWLVLLLLITVVRICVSCHARFQFGNVFGIDVKIITNYWELRKRKYVYMEFYIWQFVRIYNYRKQSTTCNSLGCDGCETLWILLLVVGVPGDIGICIGWVELELELEPGLDHCCWFITIDLFQFGGILVSYRTWGCIGLTGELNPIIRGPPYGPGYGLWLLWVG